MKTYEVEVTQRVRVTLDETKFTPEWMADFRSYMFPLHTVEEHAEHLAQLCARGVADLSSFRPSEFVEGYGDIGDMGISADIIDSDEEVVVAPSDRAES